MNPLLLSAALLACSIGAADEPGKATPKADVKATDRDAREKRVVAEIEAMEDESERLYREAVRQVGRVLTRRQKTLFDKMLGPPFDLARLSLRGVKARPAATPADSPVILEPLSPEDQGSTAAAKAKPH